MKFDLEAFPKISQGPWRSREVHAWEGRKAQAKAISLQLLLALEGACLVVRKGDRESGTRFFLACNISLKIYEERIEGRGGRNRQ